MSSSYPGGHALTGFAMAEYYSRKYPEARLELEELGERIADSRESVGLHYPSDTGIAREICDIIFKNNLIKEVQ
jgi:membrane-associated phospholipid phosphatase